ncbi:nitroreductase family protein [Pedobacter xixiisoli]|uniref:Putative NAD(P)H nitroreductase n=1 Tax=Pedobacter xixiisoli TaxID=1476464 RepID=A0A285ZY83_9SPHI|nr:nitroreductase [Pedobacter xixiisoli]SOD14613.1 Nitroreductase [Pedobacter xixiisoli]
MSNKAEILSEIIKNRRSIFPESYTKEEIPTDVIEQILESANYAPTHKLTQPWRFMVIRKEGKAKLGAELGDIYKRVVPAEKFLQKKYDSFGQKTSQADVIIAINIQFHEDKVPNWEEIAAVGCAVQNMALTAEALNVGAYWSSPPLIDHLGDFLALGENEKCYGLFYMGYHNAESRPANRTPIAEKVKWIEK